MAGVGINLLALLSAALVVPGCSEPSNELHQSAEVLNRTDPINYDAAIPLDAERLAESGMAEVYAELVDKFSDIGVKWAPMVESWDGQNEGMSGGSNYTIEVAGKIYPVFGSNPHRDAWAMATVAFFDAVNDQIADKPFKFYAINAGNDLHAIRMGREEYQAALAYHEGTPYAPYVPDRTPPNFGFPE